MTAPETSPETESSKEQSERPPVVSIDRIAAWDGKAVTIRGWLYNLRESGKLLFPIFRDGTGLLQGVIFQKTVPPEVFAAGKTLTQESSVIVTGNIRAEKRAPGGYEMDVTRLEIVSRVSPDDPYPITPKDHGIEFLVGSSRVDLQACKLEYSIVSPK